MSIILVIAAHPDDEVLGCGGTMVKHINDEDFVHVIILSSGIASRNSEENKIDVLEKMSSLNGDAHRAHKILGASSLKFLDFPDNRFDSINMLDITKTIEKEIGFYKPDTIYTHHYGDLNIDHQITHQAVMTACRPLPGQSVKKIILFEVQSSTEWQTPSDQRNFTPNYFQNISETLASKLDALKEYASEMRPWPHSRSLEAVEYLAHWRGASVGLDAAEAFMVVREIKD